MIKLFDVNLSTGRWPFRDLPLAKMEDLRSKLEVSGISGGLVRSLEAPFAMNIYEANEKLFNECREYPEFIPLPAVRPDFVLWREMSGKAVVMHPNYHQYSLLSDECIDMVRALIAKKIVPVIVIREEDERGQHPLCKVPPVPAEDINTLAGMFPEAPFVALNAYNGEFTRFTAPNLFADIAFAESFPALAFAVENFGTGRLLFGSNAPFFTINSEISKLEYGKLDAEDVAAVAYENFERIFYGR